MIPDLGKYAGVVMWSYIATIALIAALVALSLWQGANVKRQLREVEERQGRDHG
jgi:heme exporter protein D